MKRRKILLFLFFFIIFFQWYRPVLSQSDTLPAFLDKLVYYPVKTLYYAGQGEFDTYLAKNIWFEPVQAYWKNLQRVLGATLINRGEAHITVITPPEYYSVLRQHTSIAEINQIADSLRMQEMKFEIVCLGRGQIRIDGVLERTYYLVVRSPDLLRLRTAIYDRYLQNGGKKGAFNPDNYYPHITVGFTKRDLHESDGIKKGDNTCIQAVTVR